MLFAVLFAKRLIISGVLLFCGCGRCEKTLRAHHSKANPLLRPADR